MHLFWIASYSLPVVPETVSPEAIQALIQALEGQADVQARWLVFWTGLVVLGLMMEYGAGFAEWKPRNLVNPGSFIWVPIWGIMGGILVVGGVAGEMYVEFSASRIESDLRDKNHQIVALLTKKAEDERVARVQIEEVLAPRRLTAEQRSAISSNLSRFSKQPVVAINHTLDVEAGVLAAEILSTLKLAKWDTNPIWAIGSMVSSLVRAPSVPVTGILIQAAPDKRSQLAARALSQELVKNGFDCRLVRRGEVGFGPKSEPLVVVEVEPRPEGPQGAAKLRAEANKIKQAQSSQVAK